MLELPLVKGDPFHHVMEAILDLSDVAHVVCTTRGVNLQAVDTKRAAIVSLLFPAEDFKGYTCDEYISIGIPIRDLVNAIRCGDDKDTITLKIGEENFKNMTLSLVSPEKRTVDFVFWIVDAQLARIELPDRQDLEYQASVKMPSVEFRRICKYLSNFGEEDGVIWVTDEDLTYFAKGTNGDVYMEYKQQEEDTTTFKIDMQEPITLTLDLKYLNTFAKVFTLSGQVKLFLSKTHPLVVECEIGQKGRIRCFMVPKMETEFQGEEEEKEAHLPLRRRRRALQEASAATRLELPLVKGHLFHDVLEASLDLSDMALIECFGACLKLQAVDTGRGTFVSLLFPAKDFPGYICNEHFSMGIPIRDLVKAILCGDKDTITLKVVDENITLSFVSPEKNTVAYDLRIMDGEIPHLKIADWQDLELKYQTSVKMPSVEFRRICKYLNNFRDEDAVGGISVTDKGLKFFAKGKSRRVNMKQEDTTTSKIDVQEPITLTFDLKYLNTFAKVFTLSGQVKLFLLKTHPLMVECKIGQKGHIRCFVAPKMEPEFQWEEEEEETQEDINANISANKLALRGCVDSMYKQREENRAEEGDPEQVNERKTNCLQNARKSFGRHPDTKLETGTHCANAQRGNHTEHIPTPSSG
ncbi:uncharacterized protein LOC119292184 [Triticum dicoccoides]|uniref:uncharacterized protein LOC119292184 n=1 Tax=Triticum dicoccoides TaxID=85692 RepID=UPI00188F8AE7|nr:uncharacterized protein LOC119292184 [Triticum dicoccoides]XP_037426915.1 uncharacterized protein LOC119292184 [Triticum dicoccoides]